MIIKHRAQKINTDVWFTGYVYAVAALYGMRYYIVPEPLLDIDEWEEQNQEHIEVYFPSIEPIEESTPKEVEPDKKRIDEYDGRDPQTLYTYYEVELVNMPVDWDTTICESLDEVRGVLQYVDIHLDDDTPLEDGQKRQVIVTGIPMTPYAFLKWAQDNYPEKYESMVTGSQSPYHNNTKEVEQRTPGETESESYWRNRCEKAEYELFKIKDKN